MLDPPSLTGAVHENAIDVEVVFAEIAVKFIGGSGTVGRLIAREYVKLPS